MHKSYIDAIGLQLVKNSKLSYRAKSKYISVSLAHLRNYELIKQTNAYNIHSSIYKISATPLSLTIIIWQNTVIMSLSRSINASAGWLAVVSQRRTAAFLLFLRKDCSSSCRFKDLCITQINIVMQLRFYFTKMPMTNNFQNNDNNAFIYFNN